MGGLGWRGRASASRRPPAEAQRRPGVVAILLYKDVKRPLSKGWNLTMEGRIFDTGQPPSRVPRRASRAFGGQSSIIGTGF